MEVGAREFQGIVKNEHSQEYEENAGRVKVLKDEQNGKKGKEEIENIPDDLAELFWQDN